MTFHDIDVFLFIHFFIIQTTIYLNINKNDKPR